MHVKYGQITFCVMDIKFEHLNYDIEVYLFHSTHHGVFLSINEALQHHSDRHVDILVQHIVTKVHPSVSL